METQDEEEVFLPLTTMLQLKCDDKLISPIKTEESSEVFNTPRFLYIEPLQTQNESQTDKETDGHKQEMNRCRVCLLAGSVSTLPTALRDTYWTLCNASDQSSMPEPSLCLVCRRLLYNAHKFKELCRAAHAFLTQILDSDQFENMSENLRESFHHPNLTTVHNVVETFDNFNIKHESDIFDDVNDVFVHMVKNRPKVTLDAPKVTRVAPEVARVAPKVTRVAPKVTRDAPKVRRNGSIPDRGGPTLKKNDPEGVKVPNVKKEVSVEILPISYDDDISDSDCIGKFEACAFCLSSRRDFLRHAQDNEDKDTFEKGDFEIISSNVNTLFPKAERRKTIASRKKTTTLKKKNTSLRKKSPAVQRKTTDSKKTKKAKTKSVTVPKKKGRHFVYDQKIFEEYIDTSSLTLEEQKRNMEEKMMSFSYKNALFKCDICYKIFGTEDTHKRHMECHSDKNGEHVCRVCHLHFPTGRRLTDHCRGHMYLFTCKVCNFTCNVRGMAHMHIQSHRGKTFSCDRCNITYNHKSSYLSHVRIHHPPSHACQLCGYSFLSEYGVTCHKLRMHRFDDRSIAEDSPQCTKCNTKFVDKKYLDTHLKVSTCANKRVPNTSTRYTPFPKDFERRIRRSVICEMCNLELKSFNEYQRHFEDKHPNETRAQTLQSIKNRCERLCDICGKMFHCPAALANHLATHGSAENYKCDECERTYKCKSSLTLHKKIHEGVMFPCKGCNKEFSNRSNRDRHYKYTHTEVEIVKCEYCDKEFKSIDRKSIHVTHVHMNVPYKKRDRKRETANTKLNKRDKDGRWGGRIGI